uniref:PR1a n=1 Tax=Glycine max TaxID=3847 RepID=Q9XFB4_SOYBN|nr:PR1a precursor [Glycine max]
MGYMCIKISFCVMCVLGLVIVGDVAYAQDSAEDYVNAHNAAEAEVGSQSPRQTVIVPSLAWDDTVAAYAESYANQRKGDCQLIHSGGEYGENIAMSTGELSGTDAVKMWVDEKSNCDYDSNSCVGGECLHYTQVVWANSVRLGCAKVTCDNGGTFITCNYDPPGNFVGERPYKL